MSTFNTEEFDDILEKCKDQSNQAKQDEVSSLSFDSRISRKKIDNHLNIYTKTERDSWVLNLFLEIAPSIRLH